MAKKTKEFAAKDRIEHYVHGTGTIVDVNDNYTTIDFDEAGTRKFVTSMVKLAPSDTPAPTRRKSTKKKATAKKTATKKTATKKAATKKTATKKTAAKKTTKKKAASKKDDDSKE